MKYWLMKSEPEAYSIDDLCRDKIEPWDGIRNYQTRNLIRDELKRGDRAIFYHSNAGTETGAVGVMEVVKNAYPDPLQFSQKNKYYDQTSDPKNPRWLCVDVMFERKFTKPRTLTRMKTDSQLSGLTILRKGNRLSITKITRNEFKHLTKPFK